MKINQTNGFTFIEILVVLGLVVFLFAFGFPTYRNIQENIVLANTSHEILNTLRQAHSRSVVSQGGIVHGVYFHEDSYVLFGGDPDFPDYEIVHPLAGQITIVAGANNSVTFDRLTGETNDYEVTLSLPNNKQKTIEIKSVGVFQEE